MLHQFYRSWYAPNNAILVITGDVDPQNVLAKVKNIYGAIPLYDVPARPAVNLQPVETGNLYPAEQLALSIGVRRFSNARYG